MHAQLIARPPLDAREAQQARTLVHRAHAPADWILHATIVARS
jgi:hypothetical protein